MNVLYFPLKHVPSRQMAQQLYKMQVEINNYRNRIKLESKNKYEEMLRKQNMVNIFRSRWELVSNATYDTNESAHLDNFVRSRSPLG